MVTPSCIFEHKTNAIIVENKSRWIKKSVKSDQTLPRDIFAEL